MDCCICGKEIKGRVYSPEPIKADGVCCEDCSIHKVLPARIKPFIRGCYDNYSKNSVL